MADSAEKDLASAVSGADFIVFTVGAGEQDDDSAIDVVDREGVRKTITAARLSGISRLLLVSVFPEALRGQEISESFEHYMAVKKKADVELARTDLDWVILKPSSLTEEAGTGKVSLGAAELHTEISRDDVAATIVALAMHPEVRRRVLETRHMTWGNEQPRIQQLRYDRPRHPLLVSRKRGRQPALKLTGKESLTQ